MASSIPVRRLTRTTRTTTIKGDENANARPSRFTSRVKPPSSTSTNSAAAGVPRATVTTTASKAKAGAVAESKLNPAAQIKRKREALTEVNSLVSKNDNKLKDAGVDAGEAGTKGLKGVDSLKEKIKGKAPTIIEPRPPLRTVVGPTTRRATRPATAQVLPVPALKGESKVKGEDRARVKVHEDSAMAVDPPIPVASRVSTRRTVASAAKAEVVAEIARHSASFRRSSKLVAQQQQQLRREKPFEDDRLCKKQRTSSEPPEEEVKPQVESKQELKSEADLALEAYAQEEEEVEADPDGDRWVDLDAEDADDPLMVSEYVNDIVKYMRELEIATMPNPSYMSSQKELAWTMRGILVDWLVTIHVRFRLQPETLFLCVNIIDRFLSARVVSLAKLQLVGISCLFIAAKVEETCTPSVKHYLYCADSSYTETDIIQAERYILKTLEWNVSYPNPIHFLRRISKADDYDVTVRTLAKFLLEIPCLEWRLIAAPPSLTAAASIWLARIVLAREQWTPNLAHYSGYAESSLLPTANLMLNYILKEIKHESFFKKYSGKRYSKTSVYLREWALRRWPENTQVDLKAELPFLKAEIRAQRKYGPVLEDEAKENAGS